MNETHSPEADFGPEEPTRALATIPEQGLVAPASVEGLIALAIEHGAAIEPLERLMAMRDRIRAEQAREAFFEALSAFQSECPVIPKGKQVSVRSQSGGSYTYSYAPLEEIAKVIAPVLRRHGLSYRFNTQFESSPPAQVVTCIVNHRQGHQEQSEFRTPIDSGARMNVMQQAASAQTYGRRYALLNALGITVGGEDDDGQGAGPSRGRREVMPRDVPAYAEPRHMTSGASAPESNVVRTSPNPAVREGQVVPSGAVARGKNLVRITRPDTTQLEEKVAEAMDSPLRREVVEMAMFIEAQERVGRGQDVPADEVVEPIAYDRCQNWLRQTYETTLLQATASQLEALRRILQRRIDRFEEKAG